MSKYIVWTGPDASGAKKMEETKFVLVSGKFYHTIFPEGYNVIHTRGIKRIGKDEYNFRVRKRNNPIL